MGTISTYDKSRLAEKAWYKFVVHAPESDLGRVILTDAQNLAFAAHIREVLSYCEGEVMVRNGGPWRVLMVDTDEDVIWLRLKLAVPTKGARGRGDWSPTEAGRAKQHLRAIA